METIRNNIIGFYASFNLGENEKEKVKEYLWQENGLAEKLKSLEWQFYGEDFHLILFQVYVKPIPYMRENLREIENYRRKEKAIGIPIIIDEDNFFKLDEKGRQKFFQETIDVKLDLLKEKIRRNKLDLDIGKLKDDVKNLLVKE